ncbi:hypothetical protein F8M41_017915 [Gigaspora margarita]|uniref:Uncharacterized protein n=1 Tax=Gigaspora margarita TaxID=4874 RepID=A0A8H4B2P5_GIGMA|nr:hypothetical protein F8M41_017915 [Gigaspora margarita]
MSKNEFGLTITENVKLLYKYIGAHYSNIFDLEYKQYKAEKEINSIIKSAKRDASSLEAEIEQGIQIDLMHNLQKLDIDSTLIQVLVFYKNETNGIDYSKLVASAKLVEGVNREEWATMLCACESTEYSANFALHAACEQVKSQCNHILEVSFDNS